MKKKKKGKKKEEKEETNTWEIQKNEDNSES